MFDVVIIGCGLAGVTAALAAQRQGRKVALASRSFGATALSTGVIDIAHSPALSPMGQMPRTTAEHVMDIVAHRPRHPYGVMGLSDTLAGIRQGFDLLAPELQKVAFELSPLDLESENLYLPSALGALLPAGCAAQSHAGVDFAKTNGGCFAVVQFSGDIHFDARRVSAGLMHDSKRLVDTAPEFFPITVNMPGPSSPLLMAQEFDDSEQVLHFARLIKAQLGLGRESPPSAVSGIIVPPVIGVHRHREAHRELQEALGLPVVEALGCLPSVPGLRLQLALTKLLEQNGIARFGAVVNPEIVRNRVHALHTESGNQVRADVFVLATGRFVAGGVAWQGEDCFESLFGLPLSTELGLLEDDSPLTVVRKTPQESHPLMTAGVMVDAALRPMREGQVAFNNLFAAGMVLGGFASRYVLCADGVALASGLMAGHAAAALSKRVAA